MTLGFEELSVGDCIGFKGPLGSFEWLGSGIAKYRGVERKAKNIGMICAGSGELRLCLIRWSASDLDARRNHTDHSSAPRSDP